MNDDTENKKGFETYIDPAIEARIVALVLGESSDFERDDLENLMRERPELRAFHQRMQTTHVLLAESEKPAAAAQLPWRMSEERRDAVLERIRRKPDASENTGAQEKSPVKDRAERKNRRPMIRVLVPFAIAAAVAALMMPASLVMMDKESASRAEKSDDSRNVRFDDVSDVSQPETTPWSEGPPVDYSRRASMNVVGRLPASPSSEDDPNSRIEREFFSPTEYDPPEVSPSRSAGDSGGAKTATLWDKSVADPRKELGVDWSGVMDGGASGDSERGNGRSLTDGRSITRTRDWVVTDKDGDDLAGEAASRESGGGAGGGGFADRSAGKEGQGLRSGYAGIRSDAIDGLLNNIDEDSEATESLRRSVDESLIEVEQKAGEVREEEMEELSKKSSAPGSGIETALARRQADLLESQEVSLGESDKVEKVTNERMILGGSTDLKGFDYRDIGEAAAAVAETAPAPAQPALVNKFGWSQDSEAEGKPQSAGVDAAATVTRFGRVAEGKNGKVVDTDGRATSTKGEKAAPAGGRPMGTIALGLESASGPAPDVAAAAPTDDPFGSAAESVTGGLAVPEPNSSPSEDGEPRGGTNGTFKSPEPVDGKDALFYRSKVGGGASLGLAGEELAQIENETNWSLRKPQAPKPEPSPEETSILGVGGVLIDEQVKKITKEINTTRDETYKTYADAKGDEGAVRQELEELSDRLVELPALTDPQASDRGRTDEYQRHSGHPATTSLSDALAKPGEGKRPKIVALDEPLGFDVGVGYDSKYINRGVDFGDHSVWASVDYSEPPNDPFDQIEGALYKSKENKGASGSELPMVKIKPQQNSKEPLFYSQPAATSWFDVDTRLTSEKAEVPEVSLFRTVDAYSYSLEETDERESATRKSGGSLSEQRRKVDEARLALKRISDDYGIVETAEGSERSSTMPITGSGAIIRSKVKGGIDERRSVIKYVEAKKQLVLEEAKLDEMSRQAGDVPAFPKPAPKPVVRHTAASETETSAEPFSTFSLHVSDVSFKLAQAALLEKGEWPEAENVRVEEFVNAFDYGDPPAAMSEKVACRLEQSAHPFLAERNIMRVSMRTAAIGRDHSQPLRLTVLLDLSGSMERADREASVTKAMEALAGHLTASDTVTLIGFAREPHLLADRYTGDRAMELVKLVDAAPSEGGTNLEEALKLADEVAKRQFDEAGTNRIVLLTDGAANLGDAEPESLSKRIVALRQAGIAFDACGVGADGLNDAVLEALTRDGDGRYYFLNRPQDADEGFVKQLAGALRPAAKNVKVQVKFNPDRVPRYRLLGFEKHLLKKEDFRNDSVDAAEMASAEAGVAVYQFQVDPGGSGDVGEVFVRFQDMSTGEMVERSWPIPFEKRAASFDEAAPALQLAGCASFLGEKLRGGPEAGNIELGDLMPVARAVRTHCESSPRVNQLIEMMEKARSLEGGD